MADKPAKRGPKPDPVFKAAYKKINDALAVCKPEDTATLTKLCETLAKMKAAERKTSDTDEWGSEL